MSFGSMYISLPYRVTLYKLGMGEPTRYKRMKVSPKDKVLSTPKDMSTPHLVL